MPTRWRRTAGTDCTAHALCRDEELVAVRPISTIAIRARLAAAHADTVAADSRDRSCGACPVSGRRARRGRPLSTVAIRVRLAAAYADTVAADRRDGLCGACPVSGRRARRGQAPIHDSYPGAFGCGACPKERGKGAADGFAQFHGAKAGVSLPRVSVSSRTAVGAPGVARGRIARGKASPAQALCACSARNAPRNGVKINV